MSGHRAGSDIVASLRRLRDRFHDIEPAGDRPLGACRLREPALSPNLNIFALGLVILAGVLCLAMPFRGRPSPVRRVRSGAQARRGYVPRRIRPQAARDLLVLRRRGAAVRIHGERHPHVRAGLLGDIAFVIRSSDPAILEFIQSRYEVAFVGANGTWYSAAIRVCPRRTVDVVT